MGEFSHVLARQGHYETPITTLPGGQEGPWATIAIRLGGQEGPWAKIAIHLGGQEGTKNFPRPGLAAKKGTK